jgi:hypothetical protein
MFQEQVINLWTVVYDQDADRVYSFVEWKRVLDAVDGSIRTYLGDDCSVVDDTVKQIIDGIRHLDDRAYIPIKINNLIITIYGWEIDGANPLHRLLTKCYTEVSRDLQLEIAALFTTSKR